MSSASKNVRSPPPGYKHARSLPNEYAYTACSTYHTLTISRVWCKRCSQLRPLASFANNRQNDARFSLSRGAKLGDRKILDKMICSNCTAAPPTELKCNGCNKTRSLERFSSTQRRDPDSARCRKCTSEIENVKPRQQDPHEAEDSDEEYMTVSMLYISYGHGLRDGQSITGDLTSRSSASGGVPLASSSNDFVPIPFTTTNSRVPTNTTTSASSSSGFSNSTYASTVKAPPVKTGSGGFAVVKSVSIPRPPYV